MPDEVPADRAACAAAVAFDFEAEREDLATPEVELVDGLRGVLFDVTPGGKGFFLGGAIFPQRNDESVEIGFCLGKNLL